MADDCPMLVAAQWTADAVSAVDVGVSALSAFLLAGGYIHAHNGRMIAATRFPNFDGPALVPADPFLRILKNRPPGDHVWLREGDLHSPKLVLKRGRFRGTMKMLPTDQWVYPAFAPDVDPLPLGFVDAVRRVLPFCSENATQPWATCLGLSGDHVYATNNVVLARAACPGVGTVPLLLPRWAAEFISDREEGLVGWSRDKNHVAFQWDDGSWMRTTLIQGVFPDITPVRALIGDPSVEITRQWRTCLTRISKMADDPVIKLREDGVYGQSGEVLTIEDDACTPVPAGCEATLWDLRYLAPVIAVATHWNPCAYPQPAGWRGVGVEGVIIGRRE